MLGWHDRGGDAELTTTSTAGQPDRPEVQAANVLPLRRSPTYCSSARMPVPIAWATTKSSPRRFGLTEPENNSAMLATVQAALPATRMATSSFGTEARE